MKKIIKKTIITILIAFVFWGIISTTIENISVQIQISEFKKKGVYDPTQGDKYTRYYKVSRETWQEEKPSFTQYENEKIIGSVGDIIVGLKSALTGYPIVSDFITYFFGGHASLCSDKYYDHKNTIEEYDSFEAVGYIEDDTYSIENRIFWNDDIYRDEVIGLRVKTTEEKRKIAFSKAVSFDGDAYNNSYIFNTKNSHYCTDFITKAYASVGINLNYDGFVCSVQDLIFSKNTYIFFYKIVKKDITYIYYLE